MSNNTPLLVEVGLGVGSTAVAYLAYRLAARVQKDQNNAVKVQVDAGAYQRAQEIYEISVKELRQRVVDLQTEVEQLRQTNATLEERIDHLEAEISARRRRRLASGRPPEETRES